jgi:hypothetical protein
MLSSWCPRREIGPSMSGEEAEKVEDRTGTVCYRAEFRDP